MMSLMKALVASSPAESAGTIPSPLKGLAASICVAAVASSTVIWSPSFFPRTCRAKPAMSLPSGTAFVDGGQRKRSGPLSRSSGFLSRAPAHLTAAMSSGARMRPSLSVSMRARVVLSNSTPEVGQARATQSLRSSWSRVIRSAPVSSLTWSNPPARKKRHCLAEAPEFVISGVLNV